jgi:protein-disulfide isomerase
MQEEKNISTSGVSNYSVPIAIILAGVIIAGALFFTDGKESKEIAVPQDTNQAKTVSIKNVTVDGEPFVGNPNAKATLAVWSDYQCSACKVNEERLVSPLVAEYVKTGELKIVFKDFAFFGPDSTNLALTGRAVWDAYPDKYYEWHKAVFTSQKGTNSGWASVENIEKITMTIPGIDIQVIKKLLSEKSTVYQGLVDKSKNEGASFGVNATPSMIIGEELIVGVPQYAEFKLFLDDLLADSLK